MSTHPQRKYIWRHSLFLFFPSPQCRPGTHCVEQASPGLPQSPPLCPAPPLPGLGSQVITWLTQTLTPLGHACILHTVLDILGHSQPPLRHSVTGWVTDTHTNSTHTHSLTHTPRTHTASSPTPAAISSTGVPANYQLDWLSPHLFPTILRGLRGLPSEPVGEGTGQGEPC